MLQFEICEDPSNGQRWIETDLRGKELLITYLLNKGTAFTEQERIELGLIGKLPNAIETLEQQVNRSYRQYKKYKSDLQRHVYLNNLHDKNEVLFYKLVISYLVEMIPILYTPTVGESVKNYNREFRQPRGLFISYPDRYKMDEILMNRTHPNISVAVVTDGERVLGLGDQGVGSINISIAKLMLYTMCGGINPYHTLPIVLDVGTNNEELLEDPYYLGWKNPRISGKEYDKFISQFVETFKKRLPGAFLHWEDFGNQNARKIIECYRDTLCTFNDDMQGTSVVVLAALLSAVKKLGKGLDDQKYLIFGAGTTGVGIADRIVDGLCRQGLSKKEAISKIWLVDKEGLLTTGMSVRIYQEPYVKEFDRMLSLQSTIEKIKPSVLIGCSTVGGAFSEEVVKAMCRHIERPIIFPLSNPTHCSEADPMDILNWSNERAIVATGSPFSKDVTQCNNVYAFPGIGLGVTFARPSRLTDNMLWAVSQTLSDLTDRNAMALLPPLSQLREISLEVAGAIVNSAQAEGVSQILSHSISDVERIFWEPHYLPIRPRSRKL